MISKAYIILLAVFLILSGNFSSVSATPAAYKKKIQIQPFRNPPGWIGTYDPGELISSLLKQKLFSLQNATEVPFRLQKIKENENADENGIQASSAQFVVSGKILEYRPALPINLESTKSEKRISRSASIKVEFKIYQGQTKRLVTSFILSEYSREGEAPMGYSQSSMNVKNPDFRKTYMGIVLTKVTDKVIPVLADYLDQVPLDGQVIAVEKEEERMIINVGRKSGVEIRDEFVVYGVDVNFLDPLYNEDIGDRLTKLGVVRVINVQEGFSEAVIMAGGDFVKGNLVRSKKPKPVSSVLEKSRNHASVALSP